MKTRTQSSCERLSFASSQKDSILFLETFEKHISELDTEDIYLCTDVAVCKKDKIYVTIGDLSFALNNKDYDELISFFKGIKNNIDKHPYCYGEVFGLESSWHDNGFIDIKIGNKVINSGMFSRYIFADIVKYLEDNR